MRHLLELPRDALERTARELEVGREVGRGLHAVASRAERHAHRGLHLRHRVGLHHTSPRRHRLHALERLRVGQADTNTTATSSGDRARLRDRQPAPGFSSEMSNNGTSGA